MDSEMEYVTDRHVKKIDVHMATMHKWYNLDIKIFN